MARIDEYQGKEVLQKEGILIPKGSCVASPDESRKVAQEIGKPVVIKAQIGATGGVITAISILMVNIIPYHIGSKPINSRTGSKIGVVITIIEIPSTNIPSTTSPAIKINTIPSGAIGRARQF